MGTSHVGDFVMEQKDLLRTDSLLAVVNTQDHYRYTLFPGTT